MTDIQETDFETFFTDTSNNVRSYIFCMCRNRTDTDDLLQECYFNAWRNWGQFRGASSRKTWLFAIARNTVLAWQRNGKTRKTTGLDDIPEPVSIEKTADTHDSKADLIWRQIGSMNEKYQQIMYLRFCAGLDYAQIGHVLGIPQGTVRSGLHRAIKELKERWGDQNGNRKN